MQLLVQADVDGELSPADAARVASHLDGCAACAAFQAEIMALSARVRSEAMRHSAPGSLRDAVRAQIEASTRQGPAKASQIAANENRSWKVMGRRRFAGLASGLGLGIAATLAIMLLRPATSGLPDELVADHIRALQPGHLMDVISTDQHNVKPWFDGRVDFAPPVQDFRTEGFPLAGGRLDYLAGRPVAVLIYQRRKHVIDLYVWPTSKDAVSGQTGSRNGYNFIFWHQAGMAFQAVSDLNQEELSQFSRLWQRK
jgi:anti-sigma factor RsiW